MSRVLHRYPLDPTGKRNTNLVQNEQRDLVRRERRVIVPYGGAFFSGSLKVFDAAGLVPLTLGTHYIVHGLYAKASATFGQEVCGLVIITDPTVSNKVILEYQAVGAEYESLLPPIMEIARALTLDTRSLEFNAIENVPTEVTPVRHMHDIGDIMGFETITHAMERARMALELSSSIDYDHYYRYADELAEAVAQLATLLANESIGSHLRDAEAHPQYVLRNQIDDYLPAIRKPGAVSPAENAVNVSRTPTLTLGKYYSMYRFAHVASQFQIARTNDFKTPLVDKTYEVAQVAYPHTTSLAANTQHYWRGRYKGEDGVWSEWSTAVRFTTAN